MRVVVAQEPVIQAELKRPVVLAAVALAVGGAMTVVVAPRLAQALQTQVQAAVVMVTLKARLAAMAAQASSSSKCLTTSALSSLAA